MDVLTFAHRQHRTPDQSRDTSAMAMIALLNPAPSEDTMAIASRYAGNASNTSRQRMMTLSTTPRAYPEMAPSVTPTSSASATGARPTTSDTRPPQTNRLRMSRPRSSVPRTCAVPPIGASRMVASTASGSYGATSGASSETTATAPTINRPAIAPP